MRPRTWITLAFLAATVVAAGLVAASLLVPHPPPNIWPELARAGLQIGLVGLAASGVTQLLGYSRDVREYRLRIFRDLVDAFNGIKAVRRTLRGLGLREPKGPGELTEHQADGYREQMQALNMNQLALERVARELTARAQSRFSSEQFVRARVAQVEEHLHEVIKEWENHGASVLQGADLARVRELTLLQALIASQSPSFRENVADPLREAEGWLRKNVYGG